MTGRPELGLTSGRVWQRHKRNAGLARDSTTGGLRFYQFLLNAALEEFGF